jgi:hypothetical protein
MNERYLEYVDTTTREVVHRVKIKETTSDRELQRIMRGMMINMRDGLFIRDTEDTPQ